MEVVYTETVVKNIVREEKGTELETRRSFIFCFVIELKKW
jgi:hypothetical protein